MVLGMMKYRFINPWNQYNRGDTIEPYSASFAEWLMLNKFIEPVRSRSKRVKKGD